MLKGEAIAFRNSIKSIEGFENTKTKYDSKKKTYTVIIEYPFNPLVTYSVDDERFASGLYLGLKLIDAERARNRAKKYKKENPDYKDSYTR